MGRQLLLAVTSKIFIAEAPLELAMKGSWRTGCGGQGKTVSDAVLAQVGLWVLVVQIAKSDSAVLWRLLPGAAKVILPRAGGAVYVRLMHGIPQACGGKW
jgi:hypothetical protein